MKYNTVLPILIFFLFFLFTGCQASDSKSERSNTTSRITQEVGSTEIIPGAERVGLYLSELKGKRVGMVVNHTSIIGEQHLLDSLLSLEVNVVRVFSPEHGFRGDQDDGAKIEDNIDAKTGVPIVSLYGSNRKPRLQDISDLDVVVFDIQDVGVRCYTYISTMHLVMEACAETEIELIVLDRPNPNGSLIDGPVLESELQSFVGMHQIPLAYGMTIGELALMINGEGWLENEKKCDLQVISCKNYRHDSFYELPVAPSPNLPNIRSVLLYPSLVLFEGTSVSIGRGTNRQFQLIGHPLLKERSFSFTPEPSYGSSNPKHKNIACYGEDLSTLTVGSLLLTDKEKERKIQLDKLITYYHEVTSKSGKFFNDNDYFSKLAGTKLLRNQIESGMSEVEIRSSWKNKLEKYRVIRKNYLLYP